MIVLDQDDQTLDRDWQEVSNQLMEWQLDSISHYDYINDTDTKTEKGKLRYRLILVLMENNSHPMEILIYCYSALQKLMQMTTQPLQ